MGGCRVLFTIRVSGFTRELYDMAQVGAPERTALISIMDHKRDCIEQYPAPRVIRLCFDDADNRSFWQNLITEEQADAICAFVLRHAREIDTLIIHCTEGVSRSPAVAAGILGGLRQDESQIWGNPAYHPNPRVYRMVREAFARGVRWKTKA